MKCGKCCDNSFFGSLESQDLKAKSPKPVQNGPVYTNFDAVGLPLLDFEKTELENEAGKLGIKTIFVPERFCFDSLSKTMIAASWKLQGTPCPFLSKQKRCLVYTKRPFICRYFPLLKKGNNVICSQDCPAVNKAMADGLVLEEKAVEKFFSKQLEALAKKQKAIAFVNNVLGRLSASAKISFVQGQTQSQLLEEWPNQKTQGLFEFAEKTGLEGNQLAKLKKAVKNA